MNKQSSGNTEFQELVDAPTSPRWPGSGVHQRATDAELDVSGGLLTHDGVAVLPPLPRSIRREIERHREVLASSGSHRARFPRPTVVAPRTEAPTHKLKAG